jgi:hypothetical protein
LVKFEFSRSLGCVRLVCYFTLDYARLMYHVLRGLDMDGQNSLSLTSQSLLYLFVNVLYNWTLFMMLNTFWKQWSRVVTLCNELLYIISFDLYTLSMTLYYATEHNLSVSHFLYIWSLFLLLNTFLHEWSRLVMLCNELIYIISFDLYTVSMTLFDAT